MEARTAVLRPDLHKKETLEFENKLRATGSRDRSVGGVVSGFLRGPERAKPPDRHASFSRPDRDGETTLVHPLANLLATEQVKPGDRLCIDWDGRVGRLVFWKEGAAPQLTVPVQIAVPLRPGHAASGRTVEFPSPARAG